MLKGQKVFSGVRRGGVVEGMTKEYVCKHECGHMPGSVGCLLHQVRKLAEEVAEFQEAIALYLFTSMAVKNPPCSELIKRVREEWNDVKTMILGIEKYHKELLRKE